MFEPELWIPCPPDPLPVHQQIHLKHPPIRHLGWCPLTQGLEWVAGSLLEMQVPRSQPRPTESESTLTCVVDTLTF